MHLIVLGRILDIVVVDGRAAVDAPAAVKCDRGLLRLAFLGGDHHDSVGSSRTVKCVGGGVLEDGDVLHVVRVQVVPPSVIRRSVHNDQRGCPGVDGTESSDRHRRCGGRGAGIVDHLETGHLSLKSAHHIRELLLLKSLALHDRRGSCEGGFGLLAESHDENLVELLVVGFQGDPHLRLRIDLHRNHSDAGHGQFVCRFDSAKAETAAHVRDVAFQGSLDHHRRADDGFSVLVDDGTFDVYGLG